MQIICVFFSSELAQLRKNIYLCAQNNKNNNYNMKKFFFLMLCLMATVAIHAQSNNVTLLQPAGSYLYYGDQVMNKKQCVEFLSTRNQPAYETFQSGFKCYQAGWGLFGAGLGLDLVGSIMWAFVPEQGNEAMFYSAAGCVIAGGLAVIASLPTLFIGYNRMGNGVDMFNMSEAAGAPQSYWTIQGSENGIGLALHF